MPGGHNMINMNYIDMPVDTNGKATLIYWILEGRRER